MKWKKDRKYSYSWVHKWVYENLGKATHCENDRSHDSKRFEWSSLSRKNKLKKSDWKQLCQSCHRKYDATEEVKQKMSKSHMGLVNAKTTSIEQLDLDGNLIATFSMVKEASEKLGISRTGICNCIAGISKNSGGFKWRSI